MKPNDKAIEAARAAILKAMAERNCIIAGVPFNENNYDEFDAGEAVEHAKVALNAAYAAQFPPSEDYAGFVKELRAINTQWRLLDVGKYEELCTEAADALEAVLAERDALVSEIKTICDRESDTVDVGFELKAQNDQLRAERDALLARLAPVDDYNLEIMAAKEFIEATTDMPPRTTYTISKRSLSGARAAIAAVRPHIEAAERERCAKIAEARLRTVIDLPDGYINGWEQCQRSIAAAIRSGK